MYWPPTVNCNWYNYRCSISLLWLVIYGGCIGVLPFEGQVAMESDLANRLPNCGLVDSNIYGRKLLQLSIDSGIIHCNYLSTFLLTSYAHFHIYATSYTYYTDNNIETTTLYILPSQVIRPLYHLYHTTVSFDIIIYIKTTTSTNHHGAKESSPRS